MRSIIFNSIKLESRKFYRHKQSQGQSNFENRSDFYMHFVQGSLHKHYQSFTRFPIHIHKITFCRFVEQIG